MTVSGVRERLSHSASTGLPAVARGVARGALERRSRRRGPVALMYHGVVSTKHRDPVLLRSMMPAERMRDHARHLRRKAIPPEAVLEPTLPDKGVIVTFDDGYANNMLAAEILAEERVPWAVFVSTGLIGSDRTIWTVLESLLLLHGHADEVEILGERWSLADRAARERTFGQVRRRLKKLPTPERRRELDDLEAQFPSGEAERLMAEWPEVQMLSWDQTRELAGAGVVIGGHGVDHEIHHPGQPDDVLAREVDGCGAAIAEHLGRPPVLWAYPDGGVDPRSEGLLGAAGVGAAFTTVSATISPSDARLALPRLGASSEIATFAKDLAWEPA